MNNKSNERQIIWLARDKYHNQVNKISLGDLEKLKQGVPLDYIIGWKPFLGCKIDLSLKPLIPREETEFWAEKSLNAIKNLRQTPIKVLDMFAGSGCLGVAMLKNTKNVTADFAELDKNLTKQIQINLKINGIEEKRAHVFSSNLFTKIKKRYDFILANPPYIPTNKKGVVQKSVLLNEPSLALFGKKDGLGYIKKFLTQAKTHLNENGQIWMEFYPPQKKTIEQQIKKEGYSSWIFHRDQYNRWRFVIIFL